MLIACQTCQEAVADTAKTCPHCGAAPLPVRFGPLRIVGVICGLIGLAIAALATSNPLWLVIAFVAFIPLVKRSNAIKRQRQILLQRHPEMAKPAS